MKIKFFFLIFCCITCFAHGQAICCTTDQDSSDDKSTSVKEEPRLIHIYPVYEDKDQQHDATKENKPVAVYPGNILRFTISNPLGFLNSRPSDQSKVVLYVNGIEMKGMQSDWNSRITRLQINAGQLPAMADSADIFIALKRTDTTKDAWQFFYSNTNKATDNFVQLNASVGWEGMSALQKNTDVPPISIIYYHQWAFISWVVVFLIIVGLFIYVAGWTNALKENGVGAYSLSLTQLAFWTVLVIGAFVYTLVLTDVVTSFNTSILLLIGISAGTTSIAYVIDSNFARDNPEAPPKTHKTFLYDILSDGYGYSVQRIQTFAWNIVLGMYFIVYTIGNKSMPEFSSTMLFLAGISSASYLTAKGPENTNTVKNAKTD